MPFSIERQLKLLNPNLFEELCGQLIKIDYSSSKHIDGSGGDEGIDIYCGDLDFYVRQQNNTELRIWQVKFFPHGVKKSQKKQIINSLNRALSHKPNFWILCIPVTLNVDGDRWFTDLKKKHPNVEIDCWDASEIVSRIIKNECIFNAYFIKENSIKISNNLLSSIRSQLSDFNNVKDLLIQANTSIESYKLDGSNFYNGYIPTWADIEGNYDSQREKFSVLWNITISRANQYSGTIPFLLITGRSGDGKSTVLMRLAKELNDQDLSLVFFHKPESRELRLEQFQNIKNDSTIFLLIDDLTRFDEVTIKGFFQSLHQISAKVIVISTAIKSIWEGLHIDLDNIIDFSEIDISFMSDYDIRSLVEKLSADSEKADKYLGKLQYLSIEQRIAKFKVNTNRQLLIAMMEAKEGHSFKVYLMNELNNNVKLFGNAFRQGVIYVSALHQFGIPMPKRLLKKLLENKNLDFNNIRFGEGLLLEELPGSTHLVTRHHLAAKEYFDSDNNQFDKYTEIINNDEVDEHLALSLLYQIKLRKNNKLFAKLLSEIAKRFPNSGRISHMLAMNYWDNGDYKKARDLFIKTTDLDKNDSIAWQSWAVMEKEKGSLGDWQSPDPYTARWLFQKAIESNPSNPSGWQAYALLEIENGIKGDIHDPDPFTARWLFREGINNTSKHYHPSILRPWVIFETDFGNIGDSIQDIHSARGLYLQLTSISDFGPTWVGWAKLEEKMRNIGELPNPAPFTARWLFKRALIRNPLSTFCWLARADFESNQKNYDDSRKFYQEALKNDLDNKYKGQIFTKLGHLMSKMEKGESSINYYLKAIKASNYRDIWPIKKLAREYSFQHKWAESEKWFKKALEIKSNDNDTRKWYTQMQRSKKKYH